MLIPIPYAADRPLRRFPIITLFLVGLNCAIFLLSSWSGLDYIVENYGLQATRPDVTTLFTSIVLHAGLLHLLTNITYLWLFGCLVEDVLGRAEYLLFYIGCGVAGGLLRIAIVNHVLPPAADQAAVGASGAVAGILGIFAIRFYRARIKTLLVVPMRLPALPAIGVWVGCQMAYAACSILAYAGARHASGGLITPSPLVPYAGTGCWSHLGGFAFGIICGLLMRLGREAEEEYLFEDARQESARQNLKRALGPLRELLLRDRNNPQVHLELARVFLQMGQREAASVHARQAVELALGPGDVSMAVSHYTALLALGILDGLSLEAEFRVACALESQHRLEAAAQAYKNVYQHYPETLEAETALMRCAEVLGRLSGREAEAAALFREYLERYPSGQWRSLAARRTKG